MKRSTTWLPGRCLNFVHLGPLLSITYLVWPWGMLRCHIKPAACINTHLAPAEGSLLPRLLRSFRCLSSNQRDRNLSPLQPVRFTPPFPICPPTTAVNASTSNVFSSKCRSPFSDWWSVVFEMISGVKILACVYLMYQNAAEIVLFCVNYSTVEGNVLPLCSWEVKFSISCAC